MSTAVAEGRVAVDTTEEDFARFVRARWDSLVRTAYLLTGDRGRAEDLVQTTLVKVHRRWSHIAAESPHAYARAALPPRMRAVIVLRYFEDLSEADTASALAMSVGSVKSQASRGLDRLRAVLQEQSDGTGERSLA